MHSTSRRTRFLQDTDLTTIINWVLFAIRVDFWVTLLLTFTVRSRCSFHNGLYKNIYKSRSSSHSYYVFLTSVAWLREYDSKLIA